MLDPKEIKKDFPIFNNRPDLVYLDNSATTQMPKVVMDAVNEYNSNYRANIHSESYKLSGEASGKYEEARAIVANFLNAAPEEIIFTSGATHGLNTLAHSLGKNLKKGDNVVLTQMEHHSNLVPWQQASLDYGFQLRFIEINNDCELDMESAKKVIDENTKVISFVHISNALGTINPAKEIVEIARNAGAISIIDAAQSAPHLKIDVVDLDCDFLVFSGHKIGGPTGIGVLFGKKERLENLTPFIFGGGMINSVSYNDASWNKSPDKFEAGTVNIAGAIGLARALEYIQKIGMDTIKEHEKKLSEYTLSQFENIKGLKLVGTKNIKNRSGVLSFVLGGIHPHDVASILDRDYNIAVRAGHHCTMPLMKLLGINGTVRASFWIYNDKDDVDKLINGIKQAQKIFKV